MSYQRSTRSTPYSARRIGPCARKSKWVNLSSAHEEEQDSAYLSRVYTTNLVALVRFLSDPRNAGPFMNEISAAVYAYDVQVAKLNPQESDGKFVVLKQDYALYAAERVKYTAEIMHGNGTSLKPPKLPVLYITSSLNTRSRELHLITPQGGTNKLKYFTKSHYKKLNKKKLEELKEKEVRAACREWRKLRKVELKAFTKLSLDEAIHLCTETLHAKYPAIRKNDFAQMVETEIVKSMKPRIKAVEDDD